MWASTLAEAKSVPNPNTESGWEALFGSLTETKEVDSIFARNLPSKQRYELYRRLSIVFACVKKIFTTAAEAPLQIVKEEEDGEFVLIEDHPGIELWRDPNPWMSEQDVQDILIMNWLLTGVGYLWKRRDNTGRNIAELWPVPTGWVKEIWKKDKDGQPVLLGFNIKQTMNTTSSSTVAPVQVNSKDNEFFIPAEDMATVKFLDPANPLKHVAPMEAALADTQIEEERQNYVVEMLTHSPSPRLILSQNLPWGEPRKKTIRSAMTDEGGKGNRGGVSFISGENAKAEFIQPLADLDWPGLASLEETRICTVFGVPPMLIGLRSGLDRSTYANFEQAQRIFYGSTMVHVWKAFEKFLTRGLLVAEGEELLQFRYDLSDIKQLQEEADSRAERSIKLFNASLMTRNEARMLNGLEPFEDDIGEVILQPLTGFEVDVNSGEAKSRVRGPLDRGEIEGGEEGNEFANEDDEGNPGSSGDGEEDEEEAAKRAAVKQRTRDTIRKSISFVPRKDRPRAIISYKEWREEMNSVGD